MPSRFLFIVLSASFRRKFALQNSLKGIGHGDNRRVILVAEPAKALKILKITGKRMLKDAKHMSNIF